MRLTNAQLIEAEAALAEISDMILPAAALWAVVDLSVAVADALRPYRGAMPKLLERHEKAAECEPSAPLVDAAGRLRPANAKDPAALTRDISELMGQAVEITASPLRRDALAGADFSGRARPFAALRSLGLFVAKETTDAPAGHR